MLSVKILSFLLMSYGLSNVLVYGTGPWNIIGHIHDFLYKHFRMMYDMFQCMMCTSTNIGWVASLIDLFFLPSIAFTPFNLLYGDTSLWWLIIPMDAFITSGFVWVLHTIQEALETYSNTHAQE